MIAKDKLAEKAKQICAEHIARALKGEMLVEVEESSQNWDDAQLRRIFEQRMTVWRPYGNFDVILDEAGEPVGFMDHDKLQQMGDVAMTSEEGTAILKAYKLLPFGSSLVHFTESRPAPDVRTYLALYKLRKPIAGFPHLEVLFNAARRAPISVKPVP